MTKSKKALLPWERQDDEGPVAFDHFVKFLDLEHPRRNQACADICGVTISCIEKQSHLNKWRDRAAAYDAWIWQNKLKAKVKAYEKVTIEQVEAFGEARRLAADRIRYQIRRVQDDPETIKEMTMFEALKYLIDAAKMERLIYGEATDRVDRVYGSGESQISRVDFAALDADELEQLNKVIPILEKAGVIVGEEEE